MALLSLSETAVVVLLLGITLLVGFGADWLASRLRIPDVLWLIALGVIAGPALGLLAPSTLLVIAPILGTVALLLILFDAGIDLRVSLVRPLAGSAILFAVGSYFASTAVVFVAADLFLFPGHTILSFLLASALGCTSGAVIIPIANRMRFDPGLRSLLHLDGAVEDALAIVTVTTLLALVTPESSSLVLNLTASLLLPLPVGIAIGFAAGLVWLLFLYGWQDRPFVALATLGFLLVVYAVTDALGGSGVLAAIVFGGVLGNEMVVRRFLRRSRPFRISSDLRKVQIEIAFVLRTYFLFLIGTLTPLVVPSPVVGLTIVVLVGVLWALRRGVFPATTRPGQVPAAWREPVTALYARGLTSAVLLIVALERIPEAPRLFLPALLLIVGTNVAMTVALAFLPKRPERPATEVGQRWAEAAGEFIALSEEDSNGGTDPPSSRSDPPAAPRLGRNSDRPPLPRTPGGRETP